MAANMSKRRRDSACQSSQYQVWWGVDSGLMPQNLCGTLAGIGSVAASGYPLSYE
jgi:hypothetical protein